MALPVAAQSDRSGTLTIATDGRATYEEDILLVHTGPSVGVFASDRVLVGASMESSLDLNRGLDAGSVSVGPHVGYYLKNGLFADVSVRWGRWSERYDDIIDGGQIWKTVVSVGYSAFISSSVTVEPKVFVSKAGDQPVIMSGEWSRAGLKVGLRFYLNRSQP